VPYASGNQASARYQKPDAKRASVRRHQITPKRPRRGLNHKLFGVIAIVVLLMISGVTVVHALSEQDRPRTGDSPGQSATPSTASSGPPAPAGPGATATASPDQSPSKAASPSTAPPPALPAQPLPSPSHREASPIPSPIVFYQNCQQAWAAGAAPMYWGQPGYRPELDEDHDGVACPWPRDGRRRPD
jgi:hypothetical protein